MKHEKKKTESFSECIWTTVISAVAFLQSRCIFLHVIWKV